MFRRLRSWFAWRFSLTRLVVAVVFLGVFVGLNVCEATLLNGAGLTAVGQGWPLPFAAEFHSRQHTEPIQRDRWYPWTHKTYDIIRTGFFSELVFSDWGVIVLEADNRVFVICAIVDALVCLIPLTLILFLHPRRKLPDQASA